MGNTSNNKAIPFFVILFLLSSIWMACERRQGKRINGKSEKEANISKIKNENSDSFQKILSCYQGTYDIPPVGGPGTGACWITFSIKGGRLSGIKTCGVHDHGYREEIESKLFEVEFLPQKVYKVASLTAKNELEYFGCEYFEFKDLSVFLYDKNMKVVRDEFCCGYTKKCDCIFLKE